VKLIVGLGNPGLKYKYTRHNIGYRVVTELAKEYNIRFKRSYLTSCLLAEARVEASPVILVLPFTFMNLSGRPISRIVKRNKIELENILVVCDDIDSAFGRLRLRPSGTDGGHQGLKSIIEALAVNDFARLKIGISRPKNKEDITRYVLSEFDQKEKILLSEIIPNAVACVKMWLEEGLTKTMNKFNEGKNNE
jgi:PTH1 family peptidyl-tRNA hydrolase